jgi:integrase
MFQKKHTQKSKPFCSMAHFNLWRRRQTDEVKAGRFSPLLKEFIADCAPRFLAPTTIGGTRCALATFFKFLLQRRIRSLETVTPKVITAFLVDLQKTRKKSAGRVVGYIRLFFDWLLMTGKRKAGNPVIPRFHTQTQVTRLPRPYDSKDLALIRSLTQDSADLCVRLAVAIGEESGLRISEVCNLHLSDVDIEKQHLFVRLPNKTKRERLSPFHNRVKEALDAWLKERPLVGHDFLLVGTGGIPLRLHTLRSRLNKLLCGPGKLDAFSFHRLRHTAATKVHPYMDAYSVMQTFGWQSEKVMQGYTRLLPEAVREAYSRAMDKVELDDAGQEGQQPQSIEDFFRDKSGKKEDK